MIYSGGCHCGAIRFEVETDGKVTCQECNCSICSKTSYLHLIAPKSKFKLLQGTNHLTTYTFDSGEAKHLFCKTCGIKSYYIPRSNPGGFSINVRCLDNPPTDVTIEPFDGKNWEQNAHKLKHMSDE